MNVKSNKKFVTGFDQSQRTKIRSDLKNFVVAKAKEFGHTEEAVVQEIRYWQQSSADWHTNPTESHKKKSFDHWGRNCVACGKPIKNLSEATFHHHKRGIKGLHDPENMVPLHRNEEFGCHEKLHNAPAGSLTAGSKRRKVR